ncbi:hypothetical protein BH24PSE1_BH24PSE1_07700 [soil metagenome]
MGVRVPLSGAGEPDRIKGAEPVKLRVERRMLAREDECRRDAAGGQRMDDGCKLDRFGASADDDSDVLGQPSP